jgi:signal transduction histidine kinase
MPENPEAKHERNEGRANDVRVNDLRVLVVAPVGRDARLICNLLARAGIAGEICPDVGEACAGMAEGAGAAILAEEALTPGVVTSFAQLIKDQPSWSDFPLIVLTVSGEVSQLSERRRALREPLGNVLLLERPIRPETLISTANGVLRARRRQYQIRDQMQQFKLAEEALRKSEKLAVAGRLAASIAHEINNPLEAVTNLHYLMNTAESMDQMKAYLKMAEQELARVSEIVVQTLKFYRQPSKPTQTSVTDILDSVVTLYHARLSYANITVEKDFDDVEHIVALGGELRQVFTNLVANALDAMRAGGKLVIRVKPARDFNHDGHRGSGVRISVADTGAGVPPEVRARLFEPFVSTKGITGTGLGLWVSSEIVRKHGGNIRVKSKPNTGTVFSVFLPARYYALDEADAKSSAA